MNLTSKHCVPCEGGVKPFTTDKIQEYLKEVPGWSVVDDKKIKKEFHFEKYLDGIEFTRHVGELADSEGHHPDIHVYYKRVEIELMTHAIGGLSENDFILASKIDKLNN